MDIEQEIKKYYTENKNKIINYAVERKEFVTPGIILWLKYQTKYFSVYDRWKK